MTTHMLDMVPRKYQKAASKSIANEISLTRRSFRYGYHIRNFPGMEISVKFASDQLFQHLSNAQKKAGPREALPEYIMG